MTDNEVKRKRALLNKEVGRGVTTREYKGSDAVYSIVGQIREYYGSLIYQGYYNTVKHNWVKDVKDSTQYDSYADAEEDLWDAENLFMDEYIGDPDLHPHVAIVSRKPRRGDHFNIDKRDNDMNIYEQLNKIDDEESLSEKYNVKNAKELKKLQESCKSKKLLKEEYNDETAIEVVADYCDTELAKELCDEIWSRGVPVYTKGSQWYADAYVDANNENLLGYVLRDKNITAENIDEIASEVYRAYMSWQNSSSVKKQVEELEQDPNLSSAVAWYIDTNAADDGGWPNDALAGDPDFLEAALNWYLDSYYYENDHEYEDQDDEDEYDDEE